ncbi:MAG TPA: ribosome assembly RNA-binding protein YhbY [Syntrophales bacterium]|jgi:RNA-binding protein|nr:ribosome assembly RNA-binding protein YhbY [Syntrophales bacterium]HPX55630.1 ribosome assembly RNA-binding protein YhbY [Syntrophales bacterium]HQA82106.1 ribosome assembly RNA-binding protein YhbY [Syntrophales bacterium]
MLTGKQKRYLRSLGHDLKPVVTIGKSEITGTLLRETDAALSHHELIKVKLLESCLLERQEAAEQLAGNLNAEITQILGRTLLLYRKSPESRINLPESGKQPSTRTESPAPTR